MRGRSCREGKSYPAWLGWQSHLLERDDYRCDATGVVFLCASGDPITAHTHMATMIDAKRHHSTNRWLLFGMPRLPELSW